MYHDLPGLRSINMTPLYWALSERDKIVTEPVIYLLLKRGGNPRSKAIRPPTSLSDQKGYSSIMQLLIEDGADVNCVDSENATPLCLANQSGDLATMKALLTADADPDDGAHEASRKLDSKAIELLLEHDHDPNRPSPEHEGRGALAELCFKAPVFAQWSSDKNLEREAKKSIKALIKGGARTNIQTKTVNDCEKSLLLLALDSKNPFAMTKAFLDFDQWKYVNEDFNLYTDGEYTFSPVTYVERGKWDGVPDHVEVVLNLLKSYQAKRRYWKNEGEQPPHMIGAPPEIVASENARKAILAEKQRKEREKQERLDEAEAEIQAEYERRHKKAELERMLKREDHDAELGEKAKARDLDLKYQESLIEIEDKRGEGQLRKQERQAAIQAELKRQIVQEDVRILEEERRNIQERSKEGYIAAELYSRMTQAGIGSSGGGYASRPALMDMPNRRNRAIEYRGHASDYSDTD